MWVDSDQHGLEQHYRWKNKKPNPKDFLKPIATKEEAVSMDLAAASTTVTQRSPELQSLPRFLVPHG